MAISQALIDRYTTEVDRDWWSGLILDHPTAGRTGRPATYYLCDQPTLQIGIVEGVAKRFQPIPFQLVEPRRDAEGLQEARLAICAVGSEVVVALRYAARDRTQRVRVRWGVWLRDTQLPMVDPLPEMSLTSVRITDDLISASVVSADVLGRPFPATLTRLDLYPGLDRR